MSYCEDAQEISPELERLDVKRFWSYADNVMSSMCWTWTGARKRPPQDYGRFRVPSGRVWNAHRIAYELAYGAIRPGLDVLHTCDNPPCVNPDHLYEGTDGDNNRDAYSRRRRSSRGESNGNARLTDADVAVIRTLSEAGTTVADLSRKYNVSWGAIKRIAAGTGWR